MAGLTTIIYAIVRNVAKPAKISFLKDVLLSFNLNIDSNGNFDIPKAKTGGLNSPFMSIYIPSDKKEKEAFELSNSLIELVQNIIEFNEDFEAALSPKDVVHNFNNKKISLPMGMENGSAIGENIKNLKLFLNKFQLIVSFYLAKAK